MIIGAARSGKTTLAKKLAKEKGYNLISIDDIVKKIYSINGAYSSEKNINNMVSKILETDYEEPFSDILNAIQKCAIENNIPELKHV